MNLAKDEFSTLEEKSSKKKEKLGTISNKENVVEDLRKKEITLMGLD